ncbi:MAG: dTMP kinase [Desulfovibrio sp.]|nr:dTMP kinase [Desulfovibrio sp.]
MFISFEGIEGAGKTTALNYLADLLQSRGHDCLSTREPGGCTLGRNLRSILLDARTRHLSGRAELFLFLADRAQHVAEIIRPALEAGQVVLCDRYTDSTLAYQGYGRGQDIDYLRRLNQAATGGLQPELTLLFDLPVRCGLMRAGERNRAEGLILVEGRFDSESLDFHERVRQGYRALAEEEPQRVAIVDAAQPPEDVVLQCRSALEAHLHARGQSLDGTAIPEEGEDDDT